LLFFIFAIFNHCSLKNRDFKSIIKFSAPFIFLSFLIGSIFYKGSQQSMDLICASLKQYDLSHDICDGAISGLQYDSKFGFEPEQKLGPAIWLNYLFLAVLTILTVFLLCGDRYFWIVIFDGALFMFPLFVIAVD